MRDTLWEREHTMGTAQPKRGERLLPGVVVAFSDNMLTARAFAARRSQRWTPTRSSSGSRTAIGDAQGSRTQVHSLVAVVLVAVVMMAGGAVLADFPAAALGVVVVYAALRLIDLPAFVRIACAISSPGLG